MSIEISGAAREILEAATKVDGTPPVSDQALLAASQGKRELHEFEGVAVGIIGEGEVDLVVLPQHRGHGVGKRALEQLLASARTGDAEDLRAWAHGENPAATRLLQGAGFHEARTLLRMTLDVSLLSQAVAAARALPEGFEVRGFDGTNPQLADEWVRVNAAAFADHPEQGKMTRQDFDALTREPWFEPDDLRLAFSADGRLAAFAWVKTTQADTKTETELYALGVAPAHAGIGLGAAMLGETFRQMATHRPERISLYVEADNAQALPLYERAGFVVDQRSTQWLMKTR